ncbi:MAG: YceI family protein [Bacteroidota bacterium]|nr:YceI family protein [Bacteroidota bacterium]
MKKLKNIFFVIIFSITVASTQTVWKIDPAHSGVEFTVTYLVISEVKGRFTEFEGTLTQTKDDFTDSKIEATINVKSISTDNERRDKHLLTADFFNSENFPDITFKNTSFKSNGKNKFNITGDLTINGITKPVKLDALFKGETKDPYGNSRAGFKATTSVNRFDYDVKWNAPLETGVLVVGKTVDIILNIQLIKEK